MAMSRVEQTGDAPSSAGPAPAQEAPVAHAPAPPIPGLAFPIQLKVAVGSASDPAELEAERVAASVVGLLRRSAGGAAQDPSAAAHEHGSDCGHDHGLDIQRLTDTRYGAFPVRRHAGHDHDHGADEPGAKKKRKLQRLHDNSHDHGDGGGDGPIGMAGGDLSARTEQSLSQASSGGRAIDPAIRGPLEGALGADLSAVRLHAGPQARELNRSMSAQAFTHGSNVFFRDGMPDTSTDAGLHLLSHELTHTVQQGAAPARRRVAPQSVHGSEHGHDHGHDTAAATGFAGAIGGIRRSTDRPIIRRHAAFEHYMLGQLPPRQLAKIPAVRDARDNAAQQKNKDNGKGGGLLAQDTRQSAKTEVLHLIDMEMERLWRYKENPEALNSMADQMGQVFKGAAEEGQEDVYGPGQAVPKRDLRDDEYDVPIVVLTCANDETLVVSYSEMNTMPDLFGNPEAIGKTPKANVLALLQGVRQQLYIELSNLRAELDPVGGGKNQLHSRGIDGDFDGAQGPRAQAVNEKAYEIRTEKQVNTATTREGDENEQYFSALERNACHFAPESWAQWRGYHDKAMQLAAGAASWRSIANGSPDKDDKETYEAHAAKLANEAMIQNSFGEHYLQDSFAAGHLIDKTKIMQWFTLWLHNQGHELGTSEAAKVQWSMAIHAAGLDLTSNPQRLHDKGVRGEFANATEAAGEMNMQATPELKFMVRWRAMAKTTPNLVEIDVRQAQDLFGLGARQAQTFFTALVTKGFISKNWFGAKYSMKKAILNNKAYDAKVGVGGGDLGDTAAGHSASEFNLASLKELMSNAYIGASTKFFHDMFCKEGLQVETLGGDDLGRIYGDSNMMNAGGQLGLEWSAETSKRSREAVFDVIRGGQAAHTTAEIEARFPKRVKNPSDGVVYAIDQFNVQLKGEAERAGGYFEQAQDWKAKALYKTLGFSDKGALDLTKLIGGVEKQKSLLEEMPF